MPDGGIGGGTLAWTIGGGGTAAAVEILPACDLLFGECCGTGGGDGAVVTTCDLRVGVCWGTGGGAGALLMCVSGDLMGGGGGGDGAPTGEEESRVSDDLKGGGGTDP